MVLNRTCSSFKMLSGRIHAGFVSGQSNARLKPKRISASLGIALT
jgi:hypothetical protein